MNQDHIKRNLEVISKLRFERIEFTPSPQNQQLITELLNKFNEQVAITIIKISVKNSQSNFGGGLRTI